MSLIRKLLGVAVLATIVGAGLPGTASAIPVVGFDPDFTVANIGDVFSVDLVISNLGPGEEIGSFDLGIAFNDAVITGQSIALGSGLGDPTDATETIVVADTFVGNTAQISVVSLLDEATLQGLQGTGFTLATLTFEAIANGVSALDITLAVFADGNVPDTSELPVVVDDGVVRVGNQAVPEPSALLMLGLGAAGLVMHRRRS